MKKVGVLFSGGLDSTYLVWKNLKDGNQVFPIYVEIENNDVKSILEKNRIELLYDEFSKEFKEKIHFISYATSVGVNANEDSLYFKQIPIWILAMMFYQSIDIDEIQIGYVSNDDAIPYLDDIQNIYKSYEVIHNKLRPLVFPLSKKKKYDMAHELPKEYLDLIISCENPKIIGSKDDKIIQYEPCCKCVPCRTIISSNYYETNNFPEIYKKNLIKMHLHELQKLNYKLFDENGKEFNHWNYYSDDEITNEPYQLKINFFKSPKINYIERG
jgi:hypothetical protein